MKRYATSLCLFFFACTPSVESDAGLSDVEVADVSIADVQDLPDAAAPECFNLSGATAEIPFAIPGTFDDESPVWNAPQGAICPSENLEPLAVAFDAVSFCNDSDAVQDFLFEMVREDEALTPLAVAYSGGEIPDDATRCGAINQGLIDVAELVITMSPGEQLTFVGTVASPALGDYVIVAGPLD